jgi:hypothetical protein
MEKSSESTEDLGYDDMTETTTSSGEDLASKYTKDYNLHAMTRTTERIVNVPPPRSHTLSDEEFFTEDVYPNIPVIIDHLFHEGYFLLWPNLCFLHFSHLGRIKKAHFMWLLEQTFDVLCEERTVLSVDAPVTGTKYLFYFC